MALPVFFVAGLFPDQHDTRLASSLAENGLGSISMQIAAATFLHGRPKRGKLGHAR
jgi:hypothetical protein